MCVLLVIFAALILAWGPAYAGGPRAGLWGLYFDTLKDAKYIDLTHAFEPVQSVWPGFSNAKFKPAKAGRRI